MIPAVISIVFGVISFFSIPIIVPVIGLALGANSYIKERKKAPEAQQKRIKVTAILGMVCCGIPVLFLIVGPFIK